MAFSNAHVICGFAGSSVNWKSQAILGKVAWSEAPASGVATTNVAPATSDTLGQPIIRFTSAVDAWFAVGKAPDPVNGPRMLNRANADYDVFVEAGDKVAWIAA